MYVFLKHINEQIAFTTFSKTKRTYLVSFLLIFKTVSSLFAQMQHDIIGYYPSWQWYDRERLVNPKTIAYSKYSIINYAFFKPNPDGTIVGLDAWADEILLKGEINYQTSPKSYFPNTSLVDLAHQEGTKVLISVGGWSESSLFSSIADDTVKRVTFAKSCRHLIEEYKLDGIDIDWEYPGVTERDGRPQDKHNFTLLLSDIRKELDKTGEKYLLTAAFGASNYHMQHIEWDVVATQLDAINLMTYDFFGAWDKKAGHNSPLYSTSPDSKASIDGAVSLLTDEYQVPADKINIGLAFYGRSLKTKTPPQLGADLTGKVDVASFKEDEGSPLFYNILNKKDQFTEYWDSIAHVPYLLGNDELRTFVSYDDEHSIADKAQYAVDKKLRGAIIWDLTGDYLPQGGNLTTPLLDIVHFIFENPVTEKYLPPAFTIDTTPPSFLPESIKVPEDTPIPIVEPIPQASPVSESVAVVESLDIEMNENDILIFKFTLKEGGNVCMRLVSEDEKIKRDLDWGIKGDGYNEQLTTIHRELPSGKYRIWLESCSLPMALKPIFYKEWTKY